MPGAAASGCPRRAGEAVGATSPEAPLVLLHPNEFPTAAPLHPCHRSGLSSESRGPACSALSSRHQEAKNHPSPATNPYRKGPMPMGPGPRTTLIPVAFVQLHLINGDAVEAVTAEIQAPRSGPMAKKAPGTGHGLKSTSAPQPKGRVRASPQVGLVCPSPNARVPQGCQSPGRAIL